MFAREFTVGQSQCRPPVTASPSTPSARPTDTPLFRSQREKMQEALVRAIPMRRLASPDEMVAAVVFLASDSASFITGQVISVSRGPTMAG
jgi:2-hydroxycyclohexanecarboxyl-CoA dehydrogenase